MGTADHEPLVCLECGREPRADEDVEDEWRVFYTGAGDGVTLCPECTELARHDQLSD